MNWLPSGPQLANALRVLNVIDTALTLVTVLWMHAEEANPLWAGLLGWSWIAFVFVKIVGVGLLAEFLGRHNQRPALAVMCLGYVVANAAHVAVITS